MTKAITKFIMGDQLSILADLKLLSIKIFFLNDNLLYPGSINRILITLR